MESNRIGAKESYESYPYKTPGHDLYVDYDTYMKINNVSGDIMVIALSKGEEIVLPSRLGVFRLFKHKPSEKTKKIDFKLTKEHGKTIYHKNLKTNGWYARLHWKKISPFANFRNKNTWAFKLTRHQQRYKSTSIVQYINTHGVKHLLQKII